MTAEQNVKQQVRDEIGDRDANEEISYKKRQQISQKFGAIPPEFDRAIIKLPAKKGKKYFADQLTTVVYNLKVSKPFWMDENEEGELTWEEKNHELQLTVNQVVKQIYKEQIRQRAQKLNPLRNQKPNTFHKNKGQSLSSLPKKFQHPNSTRTRS